MSMFFPTFPELNSISGACTFCWPISSNWCIQRWMNCVLVPTKLHEPFKFMRNKDSIRHQISIEISKHFYWLWENYTAAINSVCAWIWSTGARWKCPATISRVHRIDLYRCSNSFGSLANCCRRVCLFRTWKCWPVYRAVSHRLGMHSICWNRAQISLAAHHSHGSISSVRFPVITRKCLSLPIHRSMETKSSSTLL